MLVDVMRTCFISVLSVLNKNQNIAYKILTCFLFLCFALLSLFVDLLHICMLPHLLSFFNSEHKGSIMCPGVCQHCHLFVAISAQGHFFVGEFTVLMRGPRYRFRYRAKAFSISYRHPHTQASIARMVRLAMRGSIYIFRKKLVILRGTIAMGSSYFSKSRVASQVSKRAACVRKKTMKNLSFGQVGGFRSTKKSLFTSLCPVSSVYFYSQPLVFQVGYADSRDAILWVIYRDFKDVTASMAVFSRAFICDGTLLGYFRDGGVIAHDDDIDLVLPIEREEFHGCYGSPGFFARRGIYEALKRLLVKRGYRVVRLSSTWFKVALGYDGPLSSIQNCKSMLWSRRAASAVHGSSFSRFGVPAVDMSLSVFSLDVNVLPIVRERGTGLEHVKHRKPSNALRNIYLRDVFPLQSVSFYGLCIRVPRAIKNVLVGIYGDLGRISVVHPSLLDRSRRRLPSALIYS